jgi:signal transduction histidine kinase
VSSLPQHTDADLLGEIAALREREIELEAARAAAVEAADAERARVARNLHDGAQQQLVAVGQLLDLARRALDTSPERVPELLAKARDQVTAANAELRELARGLHPVRLAEAGLAGAIESLAAGSVLPVEVTELPQRRLSDVIEASLYFLVAEAVTNAGKYAQATKVVVSIHQQGPIVICEISDDGVGGATTSVGSGLAGLTDRLAALGGTLKVASSPARARACTQRRRSRARAPRASRSCCSATRATAARVPSGSRRSSRAASASRSRSRASGSSRAACRASASSCR